MTIYFVSTLSREEGSPGCYEAWETQVRPRKVWLAFLHRWLGPFPETRPTKQTKRDLTGSNEVSCVLYGNDRVRRETIAQLAMHLKDGLEEILPALTTCVACSFDVNHPFFHNGFFGEQVVEWVRGRAASKVSLPRSRRTLFHSSQLICFTSAKWKHGRFHLSQPRLTWHPVL